MPKEAGPKRPDSLREEFDDVIKSAGPVPSAIDLAEFWLKRAEQEQRAADLKRRSASPSRRK